MKIGFDAKRAFLNTTGLGNYSRSLIEGLCHYFPNNAYFLYSPSLPDQPQTHFLFHLPQVQLRKAPWYLPGSLWRSSAVVSRLQKDHLDIYHGLSHELPAGLSHKHIKQVVTIHDLIVLRYPELYPATDRRIYEAKMRHACKHADKIVAISQQTQKDLRDLLGIPEDKISVIYQSCAPDFKRSYSEEQKAFVREKYNLPATFLLQVGTIEQRKNLLLTVKALRHLPEAIHLVVVGKHTTYLQEVKDFIHKHQLEQRVLFLDKVPFSELPQLYQCATIFVYPSRFEGFGIPILEALNSGIPVIAATGSCLEEAGGDAAVYVHPDDDAAMAVAVTQILQQDDLRQQMIATGKTHATQFEPESLATQLMQLYQSL